MKRQNTAWTRFNTESNFLFTLFSSPPADSFKKQIFILLFAELPWDQPTIDQREYVAWKDQEIERCPGPWKRIENLPLSLLRKILAPSPSKRYTIQQISNHLWYKKKFRDSGNDFFCLLVCLLSFLIFDPRFDFWFCFK